MVFACEMRQHLARAAAVAAQVVKTRFSGVPLCSGALNARSAAPEQPSKSSTCLLFYCFFTRSTYAHTSLVTNLPN